MTARLLTTGACGLLMEGCVAQGPCSRQESPVWTSSNRCLSVAAQLGDTRRCVDLRAALPCLKVRRALAMRRPARVLLLVASARTSRLRARRRILATDPGTGWPMHAPTLRRRRRPSLRSARTIGL